MSNAENNRKNSEDMGSGGDSSDYEEMEEEIEDEQELVAEIEQEKLLDEFVESVSQEIVDSGLPQDQQTILA